MKKIPKQFAYVDSIDQLKQTPEADGGFMSVTAAGKFLGVTRSQLLQLEARGDLNGYRLRTTKHEEVEAKDKDKDNIFISAESLKAYAERRKAKAIGAAATAAAKAEAAANAIANATAVGAGAE